VDLATISDPAERRKQRRLAKNRATAATSRERKRKQLTELQHRVNQLEAANASLNKALAQRDHELSMLRNGAHNRAPH
jgi:cyclic AMP-dependent transcription factor ATF-2